MNKHCGKCKETKSVDNFYKNKARSDGYQSYCKPCLLDSGKKSVQKNKQGAIDRTMKWRNAHYEEYITAKRNYYKANAQKLNKQNSLTRNKQLHAQAQHRRRAKLKNNGIYLITLKETKSILARNCFYCGSYAKMTLDHIIPIARGGRHSVGNLVAACKSCNSSKKDKLLTEWKYKK